MTVAKGKYSLSELSVRFGLELRGEGDQAIEGVGTLVGAGPGQVSFLANRAYAKDLPGTRAGAVILKADDAANCPTHCLVADDPYLAFARVAAVVERARSTPADPRLDANSSEMCATYVLRLLRQE